MGDHRGHVGGSRGDNVDGATLTNNTIDGGAVGIKLDGATATLVGNTISNVTVGVYCDNSSPLMQRNTIQDVTAGITLCDGSVPILDHCGGVCPSSCSNANIVKDATGTRVSNLDPAVWIDAECNYWGACVPGKGGSCTIPSTWFYGQVDYDPYLASEPVFSAPKMETPKPAPTTFALSANYPNPFNPSTTIAYEVPAPGGRVTIRIYNVAGQRVTTLVNDHFGPGAYATAWAGENDRGNPVASGIYFVQMVAKDFVRTRKLVLLK